MKKTALLCIILLMALSGCGDENYGLPSSGNGAYNIESEPSFSPDREYIYFTVADTARNINSGLYRASAGAPIREKILPGRDYRSPVINFDNNTLACLNEGRIRYYRISDGQEMASTVTDSFASIVFIRENVLVACRSDSLFSVNELAGVASFVRTGWDPAFYTRDTLVCLDGADDEYAVLKIDAGNVRADTIFTLTTNARPRWASVLPDGNRLGYTIEFGPQKFIYVGNMQTGDFIFIDSSDYPKSLILNLNQIIFTGPDGRFFQSDLEGKTSVPYVHVEG